jgi:hypothetical protein
MSPTHFYHSQGDQIGRILVKKIENGLGFILGEFFTNSSGHPDIL